MHETNLRSLDLNLLVLLAALIEHRSVSRAAKAANLSQPAMSRALGRLRGMLGDPVLARGPDGFMPTPRALALQAPLQSVLAQIGELVAFAEFSPADWDGEVTITATDHQTIILLPEVMTRLRAEAPRLRVRVAPFHAPMLDELRAGRIQLGFGIAEHRLPAGLAHEPLYADRFVTLLRGGHPAADDWSLERFASLEHVLVTVLGEGRGALDDDLERLGLHRRIALRLPHFYAAMEVVARSDLAVTLPETIARRHAAALGLTSLEPPLNRGGFTVTQIWPRLFDADPGLAWFRSVVRQETARLFPPTP